VGIAIARLGANALNTWAGIHGFLFYQGFYQGNQFGANTPESLTRMTFSQYKEKMSKP
jgi:hypothetical protein